ncbi:AAA family ATPase [Schinkia azotoformans]|uniref:Endonuclease GajA/Old nuclease/RecF-like AAA domain-containing protein n=1 Tax=Schinkia azotoformans LMG 9581 TaxID=1131731 RepID=K6BV14_SCHAZ|nr:AAA family ATPase [Schinkia azotoformans]EKN62770.1 hypothetical protein BAZO_20173 [Schinkia azotoformans LMG 9581]MEC1639146.1 AAA family ATPase [Schinkia azotoformans]MEC1945734.1 AAA family ATPase [Schinkia azotoformans]
MEQSWVLSIRDFGKIKSGEIEIAPFMLFVGENNSGKSYVMSLLWGVLTEARKLFPNDPPSSQAYREVDRFIAASNGQSTQLDNEKAKIFINWFNDILRVKKSELTKRIFQRKIDIGSLSIEQFHRSRPLELKFDHKESIEGTRYSSGQHYVRIPYSDRSKDLATERYRMAKYITWKLLMDQLSSPLYPTGERTSMKSRAIGEAFYLPASRTGFMLAYKTLVQEMMEQAIDGDIEGANLQFTLPVYRFLQGLIRLDESTSSSYEDIGEFIEEQILQGTMGQEKGIIPSFFYQPQGKKNKLPLFITSSLVTELSPLILFLKSKTTYRSLFFEEAEAHLHPRVQRILAVALVKLVNRKMPVWLTTHSDILFQQVNNLMKLAAHPRKEELMAARGYTEEDVLYPEMVRAYQFQSSNRQTTITKLIATENGFPAQTFNKVIMELNEETYAFQVGDEDE